METSDRVQGLSETLQDPARLQALGETDLLDTPPEEEFDRVTRLAAALLKAPVALVNLVSQDRQFTKSCFGPPHWPEDPDTALADSICKHTVASREPLLVENALEAPLVSSSTVVRELGVRAYVGVPLIPEGDHVLGSLCVMDFVPRRWSTQELEILRDLTAMLTTEIELRRTARQHARARDEAAESRRSLASLLAHMPGAAYRCRNLPDWPAELVSEGIEAIAGYPPEAFISGEVSFGELIHPEDGERVWREVQDAVGERRPYRLEYRMRRRDGAERWIWEQGEGVFSAGGELLALEGFMKDATDRKEADLALARNQATLAAVLGASPDVVELVDADAKFRWLSPAAREVLGYAEHELEGLAMLQLVHADDRQQVARGIAQIARGENEEIHLRYRAQHRTGAWVVLDARGRRVNQNGYDGLVLVARDVTHQQELEQRLLESHALLTAIIEGTPDTIFIKDREGRYMLANSAGARLLQLTPEEILGRTDYELFPRELADLFRQADRRVLEEGALVTTEQRVRAAGGERTFWVTEIPHRDEAGTIIGVIGIGRDVTERKQSEATLERLRAAVDASNDGITIVDDAGVIVFANQAQAELFGWEAPTDLVGRPWDVLIEDRAREHLRNGVMPQFTRRGRWRGEATALRRDGTTFPLEFAMTRVEGGGFICVDRDITQRKHAEEALRRAKEEAERASHAKNEFLSRMSHELRTPLNAILGFGQLLEADLDRPEDRESVEQILQAGRHLLELINEVLDVARIEAGRISLSIEPVEVADVLRQSLDLMRPLAEKYSVSLSADDLVACAAWVSADLQRLKQVLLNLLSNAIKYNRPGGSVWIRCEEIGGMLRISVTDTGRGIPPASLGRLFNAFERVGADHGPIEGTGLGLALSRGLAQLMDGRLGVRSAVGEGSTFWIELPLADPPPGGEPPDMPAPKAAAQRTVLLVEDNPANVRLVERILGRRPGIRLVAAVHGREGLQIARRERPDLVLLDLNLPDIHGQEVLQQLQADAELCEVPVVILSADAMPAQIARLRAAGATAYLTKPLDMQECLQIVDELLLEQGA